MGGDIKKKKGFALINSNFSHIILYKFASFVCQFQNISLTFGALTNKKMKIKFNWIFFGTKSRLTFKCID